MSYEPPRQTYADKWHMTAAEWHQLNPEERAVDKLPSPVRVLLIAIGAVGSWGLVCAIWTALP